jgi:hypothetical protein
VPRNFYVNDHLYGGVEFYVYIIDTGIHRPFNTGICRPSRVLCVGLIDLHKFVYVTGTINFHYYPSFSVYSETRRRSSLPAVDLDLYSVTLSSGINDEYVHVLLRIGEHLCDIKLINSVNSVEKIQGRYLVETNTLLSLRLISTFVHNSLNVEKLAAEFRACCVCGSNSVTLTTNLCKCEKCVWSFCQENTMCNELPIQDTEMCFLKA